ncbi:MAG TPA: TMEM175 family protein [Candidatus Elarobacter sp.]|jgi:uncharacterized membrane protein|nr:TMEM175 family protein [Candidatus Elarobacter sp.]
MDDRERKDRERFARRLEAFSDIVFGFALAQSAVALEIPKTLAELSAKSADLGIFAITFALIGIFWFMHYRVFHYAFAGRAPDVIMNFVLLGVVALLPSALRLYLKFPDSVAGSAAYAAELGACFVLLAVLEWRGLREHARSLAPKPLRMMQRATVRHAVAGILFLSSLPLFVTIGLDARYFWGAIFPAMLLVRLFDKPKAPAAGTPAPAAES